jgi:putative spermidine/putrescine transport system permease protein
MTHTAAAAPTHPIVVRPASTTWLLVPYGVLLLALMIVPVISLVEISLRAHAPLVLTGGEFSTENYRRLWDSYYVKLIFETLKMALASTAISAVLAFPVAYIIARAGKWKASLTLLVTIPLMTSVVVKVLGWYIALGPRSFLVDTLAVFTGERVRLLNSQGAVLVGLVEFALPFMILSVSAAIERVPRNLEEAAANLGASPFNVLFRVLLPMSRPGLISGFLLCFGVSASAYVVPAVLGGSSLRMAAQEIYDLVQAAFNWPAASAVAVALLLILGLVIYAATRFGSRSVATR